MRCAPSPLSWGCVWTIASSITHDRGKWEPTHTRPHAFEALQFRVSSAFLFKKKTNATRAPAWHLCPCARQSWEKQTQNTVFSICWSTWQHCNWFGIFQTLQRLWALFPHLWESNPLPGWLSGHLANPPTRRSCVDRMKLLFLLKFVYRNTPNSWSKRGRKGHRDTFNSEIVHNNFQMLSKNLFSPDDANMRHHMKCYTCLEWKIRLCYLENVNLAVTSSQSAFSH